MSDVAIIGGTGLSALVGLADSRVENSSSPYGEVSADIETGFLDGREIHFLSRHGQPHSIPPHKINYRANIDALRTLGVNKIIAVNAVGGICSAMEPRHIVIPHQIVDYSYGREHTYSDGSHGAALEHIDFSDPYDEMLRQCLISAAESKKFSFSGKGVYACTQGPRLESSAEIVRLKRDGCDIVGMTGMPEASLARELGISYVSICLVVNPAAGLSDVPITMTDIHRVIEDGMNDVVTLLKSAVSELVPS